MNQPNLLTALQVLRPYLEKRSNELVGCTENSEEEKEYSAIAGVLELMEHMEAV